MNYKKEDLKFLNMKTREQYISNANSRSGKYHVFQIEDEFSIEEKINFIDKLADSVASYLLDILNKWEQEKESLPKDNYGSPKTVSKKAWIKRNDNKNIIDRDYSLGEYYLFGTKYRTMTLLCPNTEYGHNHLYTGDNIVNQWFHDLCKNLYQEEKKYFQSIDPVCIKRNRVKKYAEQLNIIFDSKSINDIVWNGKEDITEKELDIYLEAYDKLEKYINEITEQVKRQNK